MNNLNYLLGYENLKIYQNDEMFRFSIDSVLLPNFVTLRKNTKKILDIGTGNAVVPLILTNLTNATIDGVEIQKEVYNLGVDSVKYNSLEDKIHLYNIDVNEFYKHLQSDCYDTITCNPPFFKVNEQSIMNLSDYKKIARHEITLNLDDVFHVAKKLLKNNGNIAIVHRTERLVDIIETMKKYNIEPKKIQYVYSNLNSVSNILLIEGVKNGKPGVKVLNPLYIYDENGHYTTQILNYFK
jgi:methyltransferase